MKRSILYSVAVAVAVLVGHSSGAEAKTAAQICTSATSLTSFPPLIGSTAKLKSFVSSPLSFIPSGADASKVIDDNGRLVLCWDPSAKASGSITFSNTTNNPVLVYGLMTDPNNPNDPLLLTATGNILFQNLSAPGIKSVITFYDGASMVGGNITCDKSYVQAALEVFGTGKSTIDSSNITGCKRGIRVNSDNNILSALTIDSSAAQQSDLVPNAPAIRLEGQNNTIRDSKMLVQGFDVGVNVFNSTAAAPAIIQNVHIENPAGVVGTAGLNLNSPAKLTGSTITGYHVAVSVPQAAPEGAAVTLKLNTLGGDVAAVQIEKGVVGVKATQNTYIGSTIVYADAEDAKTRTLLSVEWMGKRVDDPYAKTVSAIVGKILGNANAGDSVELIRNVPGSSNNEYLPFASCQIANATEKLLIKFHTAGQQIVENNILPGDLYFNCSFDSKTASSLLTSDFIRAFSNSISLSLMSENVALSQFGDIPTVLGDITVLIAGGSTISPEGGGLTVNNEGGATLTELGSTSPAFSGGGNEAKIPDTPDVGQSSDGGNNMAGNAVTLSGEAPAAVTGGADAVGGTGFLAAAVSGKTGCSLMRGAANSGSHSTSLATILFALLPLMLTRGMRYAHRKITRGF